MKVVCLISSNNKDNMIAGKVWGMTENIFSNHNFEFHRIEVEKGGFCSKHKHIHKYNGFYVEKGKLIVSVWKSGYDLIDKTTINSGQFHIVPPQEFHQFEALEDTIAFELYWAGFDPDDIVREDHGGTTGA